MTTPNSRLNILNRPRNEIQIYSMTHGDRNALKALNEKLADLPVKQAETIKNITVRRFIESNRFPYQDNTLCTISHFFPKFNGMVFKALKQSDDKGLHTYTLFLFKGASIKEYETKDVVGDVALKEAVSVWSTNILASIEEAKKNNEDRRAEELFLLSKVAVGDVLGVFTVTDELTPSTVGHAKAYYQITELVTQHTVTIRRIDSVQIDGDILSSKPLINKFVERRTMNKRIAMATFTDIGGHEYRYLRCGGDGFCQFSHAYLMKDADNEGIFRPFKKAC